MMRRWTIALAIILWAWTGAQAQLLLGVGTSSGSQSTPFSTLNPATIGANITLSNGNLTATSAGVDTGAFSTSSKTSGKLYWEITANTAVGADTGVGIATGSATFPAACGTPTNADVTYRGGTAFTSGGANIGSFATAWAAGNVIAMALDIGGGTMGVRNVTAGDNWNKNVANNPATGGYNGLVIANPFFVILCFGAAADQLTINFGATSFTGAVPSGYSAWH